MGSVLGVRMARRRYTYVYDSQVVHSPDRRSGCCRRTTNRDARGRLRDAPFTCVDMTVRYGDVPEAEPRIGRLNRRREDLSVCVVFPVREPRLLDPVEDLVSRLEPVVVAGLVAIAEKYGLDRPDSG